jgi:hypothetical protein
VDRAGNRATQENTKKYQFRVGGTGLNVGVPMMGGVEYSWVR